MQVGFWTYLEEVFLFIQNIQQNILLPPNNIALIIFGPEQGIATGQLQLHPCTFGLLLHRHSSVCIACSTS